MELVFNRGRVLVLQDESSSVMVVVVAKQCECI